MTVPDMPVTREEQYLAAILAELRAMRRKLSGPQKPARERTWREQLEDVEQINEALGGEDKRPRRERRA